MRSFRLVTPPAAQIAPDWAEIGSGDPKPNPACWGSLGGARRSENTRGSAIEAVAPAVFLLSLPSPAATPTISLQIRPPCRQRRRNMFPLAAPPIHKYPSRGSRERRCQG